MSDTIKKLRKLLREKGYAIGLAGVAILREAKEMSDQEAQDWIDQLETE